MTFLSLQCKGTVSNPKNSLKVAFKIIGVYSELTLLLLYKRVCNLMYLICET